MTTTLEKWMSGSLATPLAGLVTNHWLDDYRGVASLAEDNQRFVLLVRHHLAPLYRCLPTLAMAKLDSKYQERRARGNGQILHNRKATWGSPLELLLIVLLLDDNLQDDFLETALALIKETGAPLRSAGAQLVAICCWAIVARQHPEQRQESLTRSAVANIVALLLVLAKEGLGEDDPKRRLLEFEYVSCSFEFVFKSPDLTIWMPDFARAWFNVEMPNFATLPDKFPAFAARLTA